MSGSRAWILRRRVLPQHTDHAGVMWHGAYVAWLEEGRIEALAAAGLGYDQLSEMGLELPVVGLSIDYRRALVHGELVELRSQLEPRRGLRWPWRSWFLAQDGAVAAEARVELVLLDLSAGATRRRVVRRVPEILATALDALERGPN
ncbi:MAG: acyl-CoA thioesterase [Cyanobacteriota bacterium]|nr:acyl-CoA thioesterase [Cyanobacteriota bacterium]